MSRRQSRRSRRKKMTRGGNTPGLDGISPKAMQKALGQIDTSEIENVIEVIVRTETEEIILQKPEVTIMNMGQEIWSIVPQGVKRRPLSNSSDKKSIPQEIIVKEEDIEIIVNTTGVTKDEAEKAVKNSGGDIAAAIMSLM